MVKEYMAKKKEDDKVIKFTKLNPDAVVPSKSKTDDAGYDVVAVSKEIKPNKTIVYEIGLAIEPPLGYHVEIFPRSSISKTDLMLKNSIGLIDNGYRGPIKLVFEITDKTKGQLIVYEVGDRIGQLVIRKSETDFVFEEGDLNDTDRGTGGFGSTGK